MQKRQAWQKGYAMFELLIALVVWAVGILGIASVLLLSHRSNSSSYVKQISLQSAYDIIDRMRANRDAAVSGSYNISNLVSSGSPTIPSKPSPDCSTSSCTSTQLAAYDRWHWLANDMTQLPSGNGSIATAALGSDTEVTITLRWDDSLARQQVGTMGTTVSGNTNMVEYTVKTIL